MPEDAPPTRLWPPGGLDHPVFDVSGPGDHYVLIFTFAGPLAEPALQAVESALDAWSKAAGRLNPQDAVHAEEPFLSRTALRIRAHNLEHPRAALQRLIQRLAAAAPLAGIFVVRLEPAGGDQFVAARDPRSGRERAHFHSAEEFLACLFDPTVDPPASEYPSQVSGALPLAGGDLATEERGMPLFFPGVRLGYGTASGGFTDPDARARSVRDALRLAFKHAFAGASAPPAFFDHLGQAGELDRVAFSSRVGYGLGIPSSSLVYRYTQRLYRYREAELFSAIVRTIEEMGLAPMVSWQRFGAPLFDELRSVQTHVIQVWEI